jgi:cysteinyl-tRNA synthetase
VAANGKEHVKYWIHNNMITIEGQKMARSLKNFITFNELFTGTHPKLTQAYKPMTVRFFVLQAHYRSTLDFSNEALQAAEKGLARMMKGIQMLNKLKPSEKSTINVGELVKNCYSALNDDLNYPVAISHLFDGIRFINAVSDGKETVSEKDLHELKKLYREIVFDVLGLKDERQEPEKERLLASELIEVLLEFRNEARLRKDFSTSDKIREQLHKLGIRIEDTKDGTQWEF